MPNSSCGLMLRASDYSIRNTQVQSPARADIIHVTVTILSVSVVEDNPNRYLVATCSYRYSLMWYIFNVNYCNDVVCICR